MSRQHPPLVLPARLPSQALQPHGASPRFRFPRLIVAVLAAASAFSSAGAAEAIRPREVSFDDIKFEMQKEDPFDRSLLTPKIESMDGKTIRIRGFILPSVQQAGITKFVLTRDNKECCFGPGAYLFDCIIVDMAEGQSIEYTTRPVAVEGVFSIKEVIGPGKKHLAIYHLTADKVK